MLNRFSDQIFNKDLFSTGGLVPQMNAVHLLCPTHNDAGCGEGDTLTQKHTSSQSALYLLRLLGW